MLVDFQASSSIKNSSDASTAGSLSPVKRQVGKSKAANDTQMINTQSPSKSLASRIAKTTIDSLVQSSTAASNGGALNEMIEPLNLVALEQLGEPDPTAISKHDLLSAMAFDRTGQILSVGDRGGRVICFQ